jgi:C-terminal processing protease CtpA/Prc
MSKKEQSLTPIIDMKTYILKHFPILKVQILLIILIATKLNGYCQEPIYQPAQMQTDLRKFRSALEIAHPDLYAHITKDEFTAFFDQLISKTDKPLSGVEFSKLAMELVSFIHDGHASVFTSGRLRTYINRQKILPFHVLVRDQRIFITRNLSSTDFADGSEVLSIKGIGSDKIISTLLSYFGGDGLNMSALEYRFGSSYNSFYRVFPLVFGFDSLYTVTIRDYKTRKVSELTVNGLSNGAFRSKEISKYGNNLHLEGIDAAMSQPALTLFIKNGLGILKINRFVKDDYEEPANTFPNLYRDIFKRIAENKIGDLIIDIRGNGGGIGANAAALIPYLTENSFVPTLELSLRGNDAYYKRITTDSLGLDGYFALRQKGDHFVVTDSDKLAELKRFIPAKNYRFNGKVYVLIDGGTLSAAGAAAGMLRAYTKSIFIGTETGGHAGMSNGIRQLTIRGDSTDVALNLPLIHGEFGVPVAERKRGVVPDYIVHQSIHDLAQGKDSEMEFVIKELIKRPWVKKS